MLKKIIINSFFVFVFFVLAFTTGKSVFAAAENYQNNNSSYEATDWVRTCSLPKFNNDKGTLTAITLTVNGGVQTNLAYENVNSQPRSVSLNIGAKLNYTLLNGAKLAVSPVATFSNPSVGARDGSVDYAGTAGFKMGPKIGDSQTAVTYTLGSDMALFVGNGNFELPVEAADYMSGDGTANADIVTRTEAKYGCAVSYTYNPLVAPETTQSSVPSTTPASGGSVAGICTSTKPTCKPDLFEAQVGYNFAKLYITPCKYDCDTVIITYGLTNSASDYNVTFAVPTHDGVFSYVINDLAPNTNYYFKIKCINGCESGDFGQTIQTKTSNCVTSYYSNGQTPKITDSCGIGGDGQNGASVLGTTTSTQSGSASSGSTSAGSKSTGQILGSSVKGGKLAATGATNIWIGALIASAALAAMVTLATRDRGVKTRRKVY